MTPRTNRQVSLMKSLLQARSRAFTLIELLVVIAIIAILAAILFPVFAQAKKAAKITTTLSNIKQVALGNRMYASDADDRYAMSVEGWPLPAGRYPVNHVQLIYPYTKSVEVHWSSTNPMVGRADMTTAPGQEAWGSNAVSLTDAQNGNIWTARTTVSPNAIALNRWNGAAYRIDPRTETEIEFVAELAVYAPLRRTTAGQGAIDWDPTYYTCIGDPNAISRLWTAAKELNDKVVTGFADGHAAKKGKEVFLFRTGITSADADCISWPQRGATNRYYGFYLNGLGTTN